MWSEDLHCPPPPPCWLWARCCGSMSSVVLLPCWQSVGQEVVRVAESGLGRWSRPEYILSFTFPSQCSLDPSRSPGFKVHVPIRCFSPLDLGRALSSGASGASLCMRLPCWGTQVRCWHAQSRIPRDRAPHRCRGDEGGSDEMDGASGVHDMD